MRQGRWDELLIKGEEKIWTLVILNKHIQCYFRHRPKAMKCSTQPPPAPHRARARTHTHRVWLVLLLSALKNFQATASVLSP